MERTQTGAVIISRERRPVSLWQLNGQLVLTLFPLPSPAGAAHQLNAREARG